MEDVESLIVEPGLLDTSPAVVAVAVLVVMATLPDSLASVVDSAVDTMLAVGVVVKRLLGVAVVSISVAVEKMFPPSPVS